MIDTYQLKRWVSIPALQAHLCTLAIALSHNSLWRVPRDGFRYGGLAFGLVHTVALVFVAMPITLLQLAVGQLSQQDAVGMWRAVPFFRGIGYLRLLITSLGSVYTLVYLALIVTNFFYTFSNPYPTWECTEWTLPEDIYETTVLNSSLLCFNETFMAPVEEEPENYVAIALVICALWIVFPVMLYSPVKFMKRAFYALGPLVLVLCVVLAGCVGEWADLLLLQKGSDWSNFLDPDIWQAALVQSLWSTLVAGGFLVSAGDTVYASTNVQWTTLIIIAANIASSWLGLVFWFAVGGGGDRDVSSLAPLLQVYSAAGQKHLPRVWPLLIFAMLFLSGFITMLTLLFPLYDRFRRVGGLRWRALAAGGALVGAGASLGVLAGRMPALHVLEDLATPLLITITTTTEIFVFIFIYGWKVLVEDVEFLTSQELSKYWVMGWCVAPGIIAPFAAWWVATAVGQEAWDAPWETVTLAATAGTALVIFLVFAAVAVAKQVQYDFIGKLSSSFKPSRHWGPRDPITHYYWLARREEADRRHLPARFHRRYLGQLSGSLHLPENAIQPPRIDFKRRTNSDDWIYTIYRRKCVENLYSDFFPKSRRRRSKSFEWELSSARSLRDSLAEVSVQNVKENNNNNVIIKSCK